MIDASLHTYDAVLAVMMLPMVVGAVVSVVSSISATFGLVAGGIPSLGVLGYALFIDPPETVG
ncbi:hypothetical protein [Halocatena pleomorpha]|uniref:Uncharacterized protein n=1 Tax=Halocatena pleomorpha TaxID=1785090 RepID=A0A3P3RIU0_9EURY|nr:hypothetical protein [Halocatena pleomorpha]RRJ32333.1 hypothetical protein EIK79_04900 [Halocatena pleomorpha]